MKNKSNTLSEQIEAFLRFLHANNYSPATIKLRKETLKQFTAFLHEHQIQRFQDVTIKSLTCYHLEMTTRQLSPHTTESHLRIIRRLFDYLEHQGLLFENPTHSMSIRRSPLPLPKIISGRQIQKLLAAPDITRPRGLRDRAILETLYATGIRRAELRAMTLLDVDFAQETIRILGKGRKERLLPFGKKAAFYTKAYLQSARPKFCKHSTTPDNTILWVTQFGNPLSNRAVYSLVKKHALAAAIPKHTSPHTLRRSCATHMLQNGAHPLLITQLLGHANLKTLSHYLRLSISDLQNMHKKSKPGK